MAPKPTLGYKPELDEPGLADEFSGYCGEEMFTFPLCFGVAAAT